MKHIKLLLSLLLLTHWSLGNSTSTTASTSITETIVSHFIKARIQWESKFTIKKIRLEDLVKRTDGNNFAQLESIHFDAKNLENDIIIISTDIWLKPHEADFTYKPSAWEKRLFKYKLLKVIKLESYQTQIRLDNNTRAYLHKSNYILHVVTMITKAQFEQIYKQLMNTETTDVDYNVAVLKHAQKAHRHGA